MPSVLNKYRYGLPPSSVYIGRPGPWGNPFQIGDDGTRAEVVQKYERFLNKNPQLKAKVVKELRGKNLVCFCAPLTCHGDILLRIANKDGS
jgi:Domain of unknown function (DUF4326)